MRWFDITDFDCSETGENEMDPVFLQLLDDLRTVCRFPFIVNSGYRSKQHSVEVKKSKPGMHTKGRAADIRVSNGAEKFKIVSKAIELGFTGIGVAKTFIHVDTRDTTPVIWSY